MAAKYSTRFGTAYRWQVTPGPVYQIFRWVDGFNWMYLIRPVRGLPRTWEIALYTGWGLWEAVPHLDGRFPSARKAAEAFAQEFPA